MRILELGASNHLFGAERWILALVRNLDPALFEVTVSVIQDSHQGQTGLVEAACRLGINTEIIRVKGRFHPSAVTKLAGLISSLHIDLVHTHGYKTDVLGYLATRLSPARLVCTPHGWATHMDVKLKVYVSLGKKILRCADSIVPLSVALQDDLHKIGVPEERIRLILNGVDLQEVQETKPNSREQLGLEGKYLVGYIGQLIPRKRLEVLVRGFALFNQVYPASALVLLGEGEAETALRALVCDLGMSSQVRFMGFREDRLSWLKVFDAFVLPSELEGIPRSLMEAMSAGISVIASDIPGTTDLVKNGLTGLTFPLGNEGELAQRLTTLRENPSLARSLNERAAQHIETYYSASRMAREYEQLFQELLLPGLQRTHELSQVI